jgi:hypothetical protein
LELQLEEKAMAPRRARQHAQRLQEIQKAIEDTVHQYPNCPPEALGYFAKKSGLLSGNPTEEDVDEAVAAVLEQRAPY